MNILLRLPTGSYIVESESGVKYETNLENHTCTCPSFVHRSTGKVNYTCRHLAYLELNPEKLENL